MMSEMHHDVNHELHHDVECKAVARKIPPTLRSFLYKFFLQKKKIKYILVGGSIYFCMKICRAVN